MLLITLRLSVTFPTKYHSTSPGYQRGSAQRSSGDMSSLEARPRGIRLPGPLYEQSVALCRETLMESRPRILSTSAAFDPKLAVLTPKLVVLLILLSQLGSSELLVDDFRVYNVVSSPFRLPVGQWIGTYSHANHQY